ncbi:hypothetical protein BC829DRAFT_400240 [Chytridium lagenaria]|nr:hypothetical protein BC829DRAFT_400240 [Chytridium lagenaria]
MASSGSASERYAPNTFLSPYIAGIIAGVSVGVGLTRYRGIQWNTVPGGLTLFATSITGEFIRARNALQSYLPVESKLRELLESKPSGFRLDKPRASHDYSLEGSIPPPSDTMPSISPTPALPRSAASNDPTDAVSWESIRRQTGGASQGQVYVDEGDKNGGDGETGVMRTPPRTREEEEEMKRIMGLKQNQYGDPV